jgi:ABC-type multidrug transport system ATPase subunit
VIEAVEDVRAFTTLGGKEVTASQLATRLGFTGGRQQTRVGDLSGGERRRLQLLRLLMTEPNVLILDEPTNDLDIDTLTSLEDVLDGWAGTLIVVSHDRYLLERVADHQVALLGDGRVRDLPGGVDEYLRLRATTASAAAASPVRALNRTEFRTPAARTTGAEAAATAAEVRAARKEMSRIERRLERISQEEARLHDEMARSAADHQVVQRLDTDLRTLQRERDDLEGDWLTAAETAG